MGAFITAALGFPTAIFSYSLVVVAGYWILVTLGGAELGEDDGLAGVLGLGGIPVTVALSLLIAQAWFVSLAATAAGPPAPVRVAVLPAALAVAWGGTRLLVAPLRRLFEERPAPSRHDFVGRTCVIRTGTVTGTFGQAEATAPDGSTAVVQVRRAGTDALAAGDTALIFDYDPAGEVYLVMPYDAALDPDRRTPEL
ncbi:hypothetical protein DPM19_19120 [Actinomadura craniellae]|uniref:DUF1449 domain-containing protein n=1 Tax=Actinomadura craniellae TaxID=2231787 RepID=A0A365H427_9ACTN|nr:hypothetical protein [Actinomadura craniellae]RAY13766.1 hypothetical protein DPM19_19120 [Actinomadura craniellae]